MEKIQVTSVGLRETSGSFVDAVNFKIKFKVLHDLDGELKWFVGLQLGKTSLACIQLLGARKMQNLKKDSYTLNFWERMQFNLKRPYSDFENKAVLYVYGKHHEIFYAEDLKIKFYYADANMELRPPRMPVLEKLMWKLKTDDEMDSDDEVDSDDSY